MGDLESVFREAAAAGERWAQPNGLDERAEGERQALQFEHRNQVMRTYIAERVAKENGLAIQTKSLGEDSDTMPSFRTPQISHRYTENMSKLHSNGQVPRETICECIGGLKICVSEEIDVTEFKVSILDPQNTVRQSSYFTVEGILDSDPWKFSVGREREALIEAQVASWSDEETISFLAETATNHTKSFSEDLIQASLERVRAFSSDRIIELLVAGVDRIDQTVQKDAHTVLSDLHDFGSEYASGWLPIFKKLGRIQLRQLKNLSRETGSWSAEEAIKMLCHFLSAVRELDPIEGANPNDTARDNIQAVASAVISGREFTGPFQALVYERQKPSSMNLSSYIARQKRTSGFYDEKVLLAYGEKLPTPVIDRVTPIFDGLSNF